MYRFLTDGAFSEVYVDREAGLCRKICRGSVDPHNVRREIRILEELREAPHENILELIDHTFDTATGTTTIYTPFYEVPSLQYFKTADKAATWQALQEIASGVEHVHRLAIIHRDICPSNIMFDCYGERPRAMLIDFGISWAARHSLGEEPGSLIPSIGTGYGSS